MDSSAVVTKLVSVEDGGTRGILESYDCLNPSISADGHYVVFDSVSPYFVDPNDGWYEDRWQIVDRHWVGKWWNGHWEDEYGWVTVWVDDETRDVFRVELDTDLDPLLTEKVSVSPGYGAGQLSGDAVVTYLANGDSEYAALSGDGRYVVFESDASNLSGSDCNEYRDIFVRDMQTGITYLMSVDLAHRVTPAQSGMHSSKNTGPAITATFGDAVPQVSFMSEAIDLTKCLKGPVDDGGLATVDAIAPDWDVFVATLDATPTITEIVPTSGTTAGGTTVVIFGTNFYDSMELVDSGWRIILGRLGVTFDGLNAPIVTRFSSMKLIVTSPAHAAGLVQVQVTAAGGSTANTAADDYTYIAPKVVIPPVVIPPVEPTAVVMRFGHRYQQDNKYIKYTGTWTTNEDDGFSKNSSFSTNDKLATITITFKGTRLDWIGALGPLFGKVMVSVDGGTAVEVDLYNATDLLQQLVWSTGTLEYGVHVIKIFYAEGLDASEIKPINIDALDVNGVLLESTDV
jgi:hypothetical protein